MIRHFIKVALCYVLGHPIEPDIRKRRGYCEICPRCKELKWVI